VPIPDEEIDDLFAGEEKKEREDKPLLVHDYFDKGKKTNLANPGALNPMSKGFDIRAFRLRQAA